MRLSSWLYRAATATRDVEAVQRSLDSGDPGYVERRIRNRIVGRALGRIGFWSALWGGRRDR